MVAKLGMYKDNSIIICSGVESTKPNPSLPNTPVKRLSGVLKTSTPVSSPRGSGLKPPLSPKKSVNKFLNQSLDSQDDGDLDSFSEFEQPDAPTTPVTPDMMIYNLMESKYSHIFRVLEGYVLLYNDTRASDINECYLATRRLHCHHLPTRASPRTRLWHVTGELVGYVLPALKAQ